MEVKNLEKIFSLYQIYNDKGDLRPILDTQLGKELLSDIKSFISSNDRKNETAEQKLDRIATKDHSPFIQIQLQNEIEELKKESQEWCNTATEQVGEIRTLKERINVADELLKEIRLRLLYDLNEDGEPKSSISDIIKIWEKVNEFLSSSKQ